MRRESRFEIRQRFNHGSDQQNNDTSGWYEAVK